MLYKELFFTRFPSFMIKIYYLIRFYVFNMYDELNLIEEKTNDSYVECVFKVNIMDRKKDNFIIRYLKHIYILLCIEKVF